MNHFPIFLATKGRRIVVSGGSAAAVAKLRLLLKTQAAIVVYAPGADAQIADWAGQGRLTLIARALAAGDADGAALVYGANEDAAEDARVAAIGRAAGALVNIVDDLSSDFITPAIVDRDPVTVAIGTEGAAPVLARAIKADLEARLPATLGLLARIGKAFRPLADRLPMGRKRRDFWGDYYFRTGPQALAQGQDALTPALDDLLARHLSAAPQKGRVDLVGAGPGDPELLTLRARTLLDRADVVIHDQLVPQPVLDLARREALVIEAGKRGFGPSMAQADINALMIDHAGRGAHVVRLKSGDPGVFGRLDDETDALDAAGIAWAITPGITAATAAVAQIGQSFTRRGRNSSFRMLTGHDVAGFADHDWRALARAGEVAAIYMGKRAARFVQGRLIMHGADAATPVTIVADAGRPETRVVAATLATLPQALDGLTGPAVILYGLSPRGAQAQSILQDIKEGAI